MAHELVVDSVHVLLNLLLFPDTDFPCPSIEDKILEGDVNGIHVRVRYFTIRYTHSIK